MRVLLIYPALSDRLDRFPTRPPLGLAYLSAVLKQNGHACQLVDEQLEPDLWRVIDGYQPEVVGFSVTTWTAPRVAAKAAALKQKYPQMVCLAGGPHATAHPEDVLAAGADIVFRGEAERTFPEVLKRIAANQEFERVQSSADPVELDGLISFSPRRGMFGPIEITRGCTFACSYCQTSRIFGVRLRHRSVESVVRQAEALRSVNRKVVRLLSPNAFSYGSEDGRQLNLGAMRELLSALRAGLPQDAKIIFAHFPSEVRPEHVIPETLDLLKEFAGNDEIVIGAQSGSQRMLDSCRRSHDVESVLRAVALARKYRYKIIVDFIFGLPGETAEDLSQTLAVIEELIRMGARIHPHIFAPLPQTPFSSASPGSLSPEVLKAIEGFKTRRGIYGM